MISEFLGNWEESGYSFLFFSTPSPRIINRILEKQPELTLCEEFEVSYSDWQGGKVGSFRVGDLELLPVWKKSDFQPGKRGEVLFDPGVVFGSLNHATTKDCLKALKTVFEQDEISVVLDIGSGSGVLSLAAAEYGAGKVLALDNNPLAVQTTQRNVFLNAMQKQVLPLQALGEDFIHLQADLLIANIHYQVMKDIVCNPGFMQKKWCILSGLMDTGAKKVRELLADYPGEVYSTWKSEGIWHTLLLKNS